MARTRTQRALHSCATVLRTLPCGTPVDLEALVRQSGIAVRLPLLTRRLKDGHWILPDGQGGWKRGSPPQPRHGGRRGA